MALVVKDRVKVRSTTTGTGTLTLGTAFAGFQTFNNALGDGDTTYYGIFESSTGEFEVGIGTFTSSGNTLSRDTVLESSNTGAKVNLTADTEVFITYPAEKSVYFDANGDVNLTRDPQSALQAATKQYVDTIAAAGLHYHAPVRVEHPSNLTATYDNGTSGVGATLTNSGTQAVLVLDNVTMVVSDRVLIANQTNQAHNGVYTVTNIGSASTNWVLTRATDADSYGPSDPDALGEGDAFFIKEGDTNAGHLDVMTTSGTITFGTTNIVFSEVAETTVYSAGNGLSLSGTEFSVGAGTGISVDATTVNTVQDIATSATPTFAGLNTTADITFGDNDKAIFGAGSDLQIYSDGANSIIQETDGTGNLLVRASNINLQNSGATATLAQFIDGGKSSLRYNGSEKLATTSTGIDVTGTVTADGLTVDGTNDVALITTNQSNYTEGLTLRNTANWGYGTSLSFEAITSSGGSNAEVGRITSTWNTTGYHGLDFYTLNNNTLLRHMRLEGDGDFALYEDTGTNVNFFWDASTMALGIGTGTTTPTNPLTIQQTSVHWPYIALTNSSGVTKSQFGYQVNDDLLDIAANSGGIKFRTNNTETMRITSTGNVGINNTAPSALLEVGNADDFTLGGTSGDSLESLRLTYDTVNADRLVFSTERTSTGTTWAEAAHRIQRLVDVTNMGYMQFGHHNSDLITFGENTTEYARIDGDGNLLVGKTSTNTINTVGHDITDHGEVMHTTNGGTTMYLNRKTSDGTIIDLRKDGTTVGSIGTSGGDLNIGTGDTGLGFADSLDSILPMTITGNTVRDNAIDIGYSIYRFKDLYLSGSLSDGTTSRTVADIVGLTSSQFLRSDADDTTTGTLTIDSTTQTSFNVEYANDGAGIGPILRTFRDSASPAVSDSLGGIDFKGNNSAGSEKFYARIKGVIIDPADTTEDGAVEISVSKAGTAAWETSALVAKFDPNGMELRGDLRFEGATADSFETTVTVTDPTADRTITLPNATGTAVLSTTLIEGTSFSGTYPVLFGVDNATGRVFENNSILYNGTSNVLTISGNTVWHAGNDGSGSGLDADTVDGIEASSFLRSDASDTTSGNTITFSSTSASPKLDMTGNGGSSSYNYLMRGWNDGGLKAVHYINGSARTTDGGVNTYTIRNDGGPLRLGRTSQSTLIEGSGDLTYNGNEVWHAGNDGSGSGLDADTLDGNHASAFQTASTALGYVDVATGNYGTIKVDDDRGVTWAGYAIRDDWVFMSSGDGAAGIYNDTDNEWAIYCVRNAQTSLYYNGTATFATTSGGAAVTGALTATGDITAYFSDERLKDFDGKIEGALDKVSQLNGYYYHENDKAKELGFDNDARQVGVSAQEVEAVLPEVIKPAPVDPEYKTVQYEKLVPLLIEAIKELKEEVRQLKEEKA